MYDGAGDAVANQRGLDRFGVRECCAQTRVAQHGLPLGQHRRDRGQQIVQVLDLGASIERLADRHVELGVEARRPAIDA